MLRRSGTATPMALAWAGDKKAVQDQWFNVDECNELGAQIRESREKGM